MKLVDANQIPTKITSVPTDDLMYLYKRCKEMEILCIKEMGIGLSAVQVGIPWSLFLVRLDDTCPVLKDRGVGYFIDCDYEPVSDEKIDSLESCLSLRNKEGLRKFHVERYNKIKVIGKILRDDLGLMVEDIEFEIDSTQQSIVFQHEIDHSFGHERLLTEIGKEVFVWQ